MTVYYYDDPPFKIKKENFSVALDKLKEAQLGKYASVRSFWKDKKPGKHSIQHEEHLHHALSKLSFSVAYDGDNDLIIKEIDKFKKVAGLLTEDRSVHCKTVFKALGSLGENVFSFVERENNIYQKHRYEGEMYKCINMNVAIYDPEDIKSIKVLTEQIINKAVKLGTSENEIKSWISNSLVDLIMDA